MNTSVSHLSKISFCATLSLNQAGVHIPVEIVFCESIDESSLAAIHSEAASKDKIVVVFYSEGTTADEVRALEAGASECYHVPFSVDRLQAQLRALAKHRPAASHASASSLQVDPLGFRVSVCGESIRLSPLEFRLLAELWQRRGQIVPHQHLEQVLYGDTGPDCRQGLRQLVHRLRQRLKSFSNLVQAVPRVGYMLQLSPAPEGTDLLDPPLRFHRA